MKGHRTIAATILIILGSAAGCAPEYADMDKLTPGIMLEPELPGAASAAPLRAVPPKGLALTKISEGFVSRLYHDAAGYCTIGYGHLVRKGRCDGTESAEFKAGLTEPRGGDLLTVDMRGAQRVVADAVQVPLSDSQYGALCDFVFNAGGNAFRSSTLLREINAGRMESVPTQLRRWVLAGGKKWPGLVTRREREIELFFDGLPMPERPPGPAAVLEPLDIRAVEQ